MNVKPRQRYTAEFKAQAVALLETGKPVSQVAEELCLSSNLLHSWKNNMREARPESRGSRAAGESPGAEELRSLRRENALLKQENDILKKAAVILGTRPQPNSGK